MSGAEGVGRVLEGALGGVQSEAEDRAWGRVDHRCRGPFRDIFCGPRYEMQLA